MSKSYPYGTGAVKWISTGWLEDHLPERLESQVEERELMILDCQTNVHDYIKEQPYVI